MAFYVDVPVKVSYYHEVTVVIRQSDLDEAGCDTPEEFLALCRDRRVNLESIVDQSHCFFGKPYAESREVMTDLAVSMEFPDA